MKKDEIVFLNSVFFVLGFTIVFSILGIMLQTVLLHLTFSAMETIKVVGGTIIIVFGVLMIASYKYIIPFFSVEHKIKVKRYNNIYLSSLIFGIAFALGWTPCVGSILGSIYALAAASPGLSFLLLLSYSIGLGIPFLILGAFISKISNLLEKIRKFLRYFSIISGLFLVSLGILVVTGYIGLISVFLVGSGGPMSLSADLNFLFAMIAGVLTFLSPCILPLLPAYFSYIAGTAVETVKR
jgi:cytochrome c-type biogenesis protein